MLYFLHYIFNVLAYIEIGLFNNFMRDVFCLHGFYAFNELHGMMQAQKQEATFECMYGSLE